MMRRLTPCALVLVLALGCASAGPAGPPARDGCGWARAPRVHEAVLDSAALAAQLADLLAAAATPGRAGFTVHFTDGGRVIARDSASLTPAALDSAETAIEMMLLPPEPGRIPPPFHLLAAEGQVAALGIEACAPVLTNREEMVLALARAQREIMRDAAVLIRIRIDSTGVPQDVAIERSSGDPDADAMALAIGYVARFRPGVFDGVTLGGMVELPITFTTR